MTREEYQQTIFFPIGEPNIKFARVFDGKSYTSPAASGLLKMNHITFEPGCRNYWHIHKADEGGGQLLICTGGKGWYQEWGKEPVEMIPGTVIEIAPNVKHWHGAAKDSWFSHLSYGIPGKNTSTEWCEPVTDDLE